MSVEASMLWNRTLLVKNVIIKKKDIGTSLVAHWLRLYVSTAGGMGSTPGWETKTLHTLYSVTQK